jgi:ATP-dependent Clp protease adaptor protein ClpS
MGKEEREEREEKEEREEEGVDTKQILLPQFKIILHNDDITPMDFVMAILDRFFSLTHEKSREVMIEAHKNGTALVAVMPLEHAEFVVEQAHTYARGHDFPLTFTIEPV